MSEIKNIIYITYQSFPANTANSLQTISNIKYFIKNGVDVNLVFPLREKKSSANLIAHDCACVLDLCLYELTLLIIIESQTGSMHRNSTKPSQRTH